MSFFRGWIEWRGSCCLARERVGFVSFGNKTLMDCSGHRGRELAAILLKRHHVRQLSSSKSFPSSSLPSVSLLDEMNAENANKAKRKVVKKFFICIEDDYLDDTTLKPAEASIRENLPSSTRSDQIFVQDARLCGHSGSDSKSLPAGIPHPTSTN